MVLPIYSETKPRVILLLTTEIKFICNFPNDDTTVESYKSIWPKHPSNFPVL